MTAPSGWIRIVWWHPTRIHALKQVHIFAGPHALSRRASPPARPLQCRPHSTLAQIQALGHFHMNTGPEEPENPCILRELKTETCTVARSYRYMPLCPSTHPQAPRQLKTDAGPGHVHTNACPKASELRCMPRGTLMQLHALRYLHMDACPKALTYRSSHRCRPQGESTERHAMSYMSSVRTDVGLGKRPHRCVARDI